MPIAQADIGSTADQHHLFKIAHIEKRMICAAKQAMGK
jgi:hypothetical protein